MVKTRCKVQSAHHIIAHYMIMFFFSSLMACEERKISVPQSAKAGWDDLVSLHSFWPGCGWRLQLSSGIWGKAGCRSPSDWRAQRPVMFLAVLTTLLALLSLSIQWLWPQGLFSQPLFAPMLRQKIWWSTMVTNFWRPALRMSLFVVDVLTRYKWQTVKSLHRCLCGFTGIRSRKGKHNPCLN